MQRKNIFVIFENLHMERPLLCAIWIFSMQNVWWHIVQSQPESFENLCSREGIYAKPGDCSHYILCSGGRPYNTQCPPGTFFDPRLRLCGTSKRFCSSPAGGASAPLSVQKFTPSESTHSANNTDIFEKIKDFVQNGLMEAKRRAYTMLKKEALYATQYGSPNPFSGVARFLGSSPLAKQLTLPAIQQLECLKIMRDHFNLDGSQMMELFKRFKSVLKPSGLTLTPDMALPTPTADVCPFPENTEMNNCNPRYKYRPIDGSCNNLQRPLWGKSNRALGRFLEPDYGDFIEQPRRAKDGGELPSARLVSMHVFQDKSRRSAVHTMMLMTFGQFLDHDLDRTAVSKLTGDERGTGELQDVRCGDVGCDTKGYANRACFPISVPKGDPDFRNTNSTCLMFVRTQEALRDDCSLGPREQLNQLTSYIDASCVYGSTLEEAHQLRDWAFASRGKLRITPHYHQGYKPLLPQKTNKFCRDTTSRIQCFEAGDGRVNEFVGLTAVHTLFHREHNRIEEELHHLNPHWDGERLFQETRRIMAALLQHITYNEYLPVVLGPSSVAKYGLKLRKYGYYDVYDEKVNVDISNAFATAAFRFGHSEIGKFVRFADQGYRRYEHVPLSMTLRRPYEIYNTHRPGGSGIDSVTLGMISQPVQGVENHFTKQITKHLFSENPPNEPGTDLGSINIQRGRDHGLPGYNKWREWCGLGKATTFPQLFKDIPNMDIRRRLRQLYRHVDDVDLYVGGISERHLPGARVGPTFGCIIGTQFRNLRTGDRFWYERSDHIVGFTPAQLSEIRKATLAKLICLNCDRVETIQPYVLLQPISEAAKKLGGSRLGDVYNLASLFRGQRNERRPCSSIMGMDLTKWKMRR